MRADCPDYSGGTMPDLHRLPFYALAGTQDLLPRIYHIVNSCLPGAELNGIYPRKLTDKMVRRLILLRE